MIDSKGRSKKGLLVRNIGRWECWVIQPDNMGRSPQKTLRIILLKAGMIPSIFLKLVRVEYQRSTLVQLLRNVVVAFSFDCHSTAGCDIQNSIRLYFILSIYKEI
jgi:hypothetical protein